MISLRSAALTVALIATSQTSTTAAEMHQRSDYSPESDFVIIQSQIMARSTFRLNRRTGDTYQLMEDPKTGLFWAPLVRQDHPEDVRTAGDPNDYQIFLSGLATKDTFLLNGKNGATWQIVESSERVLSWSPLLTAEPSRPSIIASAGEEEELLDRWHPAWRRDVLSESFALWVEAQPPGIGALAASKKAVDVAQALDYYYDSDEYAATQPAQ